MIIEILLGIIVLLLTLMGLGLVKLQRKISKQYNLSNIQESSSKLREGLGNLGKKLYQYKPEDLVEKFSRYKKIAETLDRIVEKIYKPDFVKTLQNVEIIKQYTQAALHILYKYKDASKDFLINKLGRVIDAISVLGEELAPYEGVKGVGKVKYKPKFQPQA